MPKTDDSAIVVSLDEVYIHDDLNNRMLEDEDEAIAGLAGQIESTDGLLQPIVICPTPDNHATEHNKPYELISGYRRCKALNHLAQIRGDEKWITEVPARLRDCHPKQRHVDQLIENLARKDLNQMELANALVKALDDPDAKMTQTELAESLNLSDPYVSQLVSAARTLHPDVQEMVLKEKISWSHAKEICNAKLTPEQQLACMAVASTTVFAEFQQWIADTFKKDRGAKNDEAAPATTDKAAGQKTLSTGISPRVIKDKYLPYFSEMKTKTKGNEQKKWAIYEDAAKFFLKVDGTELGAALEPWEKELQAKADQEKLEREANALREKYLRECYKVIDNTLAWEPPYDAPERKKYNLADALKVVKDSVAKNLADAKAEGLPEGTLKAGFKLGKSLDDFMTEISNGWQQRRKEAQERAEKIKATREAKKREEKEKEESAKLQQAAPTGQPAVAAAAV